MFAGELSVNELEKAREMVLRCAEEAQKCFFQSQEGLDVEGVDEDVRRQLMVFRQAYWVIFQTLTGVGAFWFEEKIRELELGKEV